MKVQLTYIHTWQCLAMLDASMAYTRLAPACMAKNDKMPDPAPTSKTTFTRHTTTCRTFENSLDKILCSANASSS